jgi:Tfp pilus assembly protein PilF
MNRSLTIGASVVLAVAGCAASLAAPPHYLSARRVAIEFEPANPAPITEADLWISTDSARTWQLATAIRDPQSRTITHTLPKDGQYDLFIILRNENGASATPPEPGATPNATIIVDTIPPLLQAHSSEPTLDNAGQHAIRIETTLVEENLGQDALRIFYRTTDSDWADGGPVHIDAGSVIWPLADIDHPSIDLRLVATDRAGNRANSETLSVTLPAPAAESAAPHAHEPRIPSDEVDSSAAPDAPSTFTVEPVTVDPVTIDPVAPVNVAPTPTPPETATDRQKTKPEPKTTPPAAPRRKQPRPNDQQNLHRLRELADRFLNEGSYALAAARLEDAIQLDPTNTDLLVDLGSALYRLKRYDAARGHFAKALQLVPNHIDAVEGLALVAATQKRYPEAREHLLNYLKQVPDSDSGWLRYGDIEKKLGNDLKAFEAWQHVLELPTANETSRANAKRRLDYFRTLVASPSPDDS